MKKITTIAAVFLALVAGPVAAQAYGSYAPSYVMSNSCIGLSRDLSIGSRGTDVTALQQFLLERHYPGSGAWMVTGYYGQATAAAVRNFQGAQGLSQTGSVDGSTRLAIDRVSCDSSSSYSYPVASVPAPVYTPAVPATIAPPLTYAAYPQYWGGSFYQNYQNPGYVYSCDSYGTNGCPCTYAGYSSSLYGTNCGANAALAITYLNPAQGSTGTSVTVFGSGFSATNNTVRFGSGIITGLNSPDGRSVSFLVPSKLDGYGGQTVVRGTYYVSVSNASGATSGTLPFVVNSVGTIGAPTITSVSGPTTLAVGTTGQWVISVNNPSGSTFTTVTASWGDPVYGAHLAAPQQIFGNGQQTTSFAHAYAQPGTYTITFTVTNGAGQTAVSTQTITVTGSGTTGSIGLATVAPTVGGVGTQIVLSGSGFTQDNTIHFGVGGTQHVPSWNGTTLYYTIPQYLSPCDVTTTGGFCAQYLQQMTPGQYPVYVTNSNGTTQTLYFQVQ